MKVGDKVWVVIFLIWIISGAHFILENKGKEPSTDIEAFTMVMFVVASIFLTVYFIVHMTYLFGKRKR